MPTSFYGRLIGRSSAAVGGGARCLAAREALAEAHFQRGDAAAALEQIGQCAAVEPKSAYYAKLRRRVEAGDPAAPLPEGR